MRTVDVPGGHAQIRELGEMSVRHRHMVQASFMSVAHLYTSLPPELLEKTVKKGKEGLDARQKANMMILGSGMSEEDAMKFLGQQSSAIVAFLAGWDLNQPLPTMDTVLDLAPDVYDALAVEVAAPAAQLALGTVNLDPVPREVDPAAPFGESETSNGQSSTPEIPTPKSTGKQRKGSESTATAGSTA